MVSCMIPYRVSDMITYMVSLSFHVCFRTKFDTWNKKIEHDVPGMQSTWCGIRHEQHVHTWVHTQSEWERSSQSQGD